MASRKSVEVNVPEPEADKPKLGQVGIVVAVCFLAGVAWPKLAGVTLVPRAPGTEQDDPEPAASAVVSAKPTPSAAPNPEPESVQQIEYSETVQIEVQESLVVSCYNQKGAKLKKAKCDKPDIDDVALPRLQALVNCAGTEDASGILSIGLELDFGEDQVEDVVRGQSTTLSRGTTDKLLRCAKKEFSGASLENVEHEHARYSFYYLAKFILPGAPLSKPSPEEHIKEASGTATVVWESARIRRQPEKDSEVQARLLYGARVFVTARKGEWYRVRYDAKGRQGWVHENAIGM